MRVALDTNIWSYLADASAVAEFDARAATAGLRVVTPPSILLEVLYTRDPARRRAIVEALCSGRRIRPPSEAQTMCEEVIAEIRRLHPEWLRRMPDTAEVASLNSFWTKRIWREARDRAREARVDGVERRHQELITRNQRNNTLKARDQGFDIHDLNALLAKPEDGDALRGRGWRDERPAAMWRAENALLYWFQVVIVGSRAVVTREDATFADWVGAYVDLRELRRHEDEFFAMWLYDVETNAMLRNWVAWAIVWAQMQRRVEESGAIDAQHSPYLCDCDVFLTADKRFAHALNIVAEQAPAPIGKTRLVSGGSRNIVESIFEVLC
jgi:hypothetical protein